MLSVIPGCTPSITTLPALCPRQTLKQFKWEKKRYLPRCFVLGVDFFSILQVKFKETPKSNADLILYHILRFALKEKKTVFNVRVCEHRQGKTCYQLSLEGEVLSENVSATLHKLLMQGCLSNIFAELFPLIPQGKSSITLVFTLVPNTKCLSSYLHECCR